MRSFKAVDCSGLARVDFLMDPQTRIKFILNEINTMPGFTAISMYPKLWAASGAQVSRPHRPPHPIRTRTPSRQEEKSIQPLKALNIIGESPFTDWL